MSTPKSKLPNSYSYKLIVLELPIGFFGGDDGGGGEGVHSIPAASLGKFFS